MNMVKEIVNEAAPSPFEHCPVCGSALRMTLLPDWQESGAAIPIVGCGNPWHYTNIEQPSDLEHELG
jgi:hypothetical protein